MSPSLSRLCRKFSILQLSCKTLFFCRKFSILQLSCETLLFCRKFSILQWSLIVLLFKCIAFYWSKEVVVSKKWGLYEKNLDKALAFCYNKSTKRLSENRSPYQKSASESRRLVQGGSVFKDEFLSRAVGWRHKSCVGLTGCNRYIARVLIGALRGLILRKIRQAEWYRGFNF